MARIYSTVNPLKESFGQGGEFVTGEDSARGREGAVDAAIVQPVQHSRGGECGAGKVRGAIGGANREGRVQLIGQRVAEDADDEMDIVPDAARRQPNLQVGQVVGGRRNHGIGVVESNLAEYCRVARVALDDGDDGEVGDAPQKRALVAGEGDRDNVRRSAQASKTLDDAIADLANAADDNGIVVGRGMLRWYGIIAHNVAQAHGFEGGQRADKGHMIPDMEVAVRVDMQTPARAGTLVEDEDAAAGLEVA